MKVGDKVLVTDSGRNYPFYPDKKKELGFKNPEENLYFKDVGYNLEFEVFSLDYSDKDISLAGIRNTSGDEYLFNILGLKLVKNSKTIKSKMKQTFKIGDIIIPLRTGGNDSIHDKTRQNYTDVDLDRELGKIISIEKDSSDDFNVAVLHTGYVLRVEEFNDYFTKKQKEILKTIEMKTVKTQTIFVNGVEREVTVAVVVESGLVRAGYSVKIPTDKSNPEMAAKIAEGRALNDRTNLLEMIIDPSMKKKYILNAIADNTLKMIERGVIEIKGVK